jgi:hypothetical protein
MIIRSELVEYVSLLGREMKDEAPLATMEIRSLKASPTQSVWTVSERLSAQRRPKKPRTTKAMTTRPMI